MNGHALLALAQICAAIDIEQLDFTHQRAGLLDGFFDLAAGSLFIADQCQITLDSSIGAERLIAQLTIHAGHQSLVIQLAQINILAVLLILCNFQLAVDLVGQLAKYTQTLVTAVNSGTDAGVQPRGGLALVVKVQAKAGCQCFQCTLDGEEIFFQGRMRRCTGSGARADAR